MSWTVKKGSFTRMGVTRERDGYNFCFECRREVSAKIFIKNKKNHTITKMEVPKEYSLGNLRAIRILNISMEEYWYLFELDGEKVVDPYAKWLKGRERWADRSRIGKTDHLWCGVLPASRKRYVDAPKIPRKDMVIYKLQVRGFTEQLSEKMAEHGTFKGVTKKIPYLQSLGITSVLFMPVYEFEEVVLKENGENEPLLWMTKEGDRYRPKQKKKTDCKINVWGYGMGDYMCPKSSFSYGEDPVSEWKECIETLHKHGMECLMEMYFADNVKQSYIVEVLRFWVTEYNVDGFLLHGNHIPMRFVMEDAILADTKILHQNIELTSQSLKSLDYIRYFVYNDEFLYPVRKLLNDYNGNVWELANQMKKQNQEIGYINYITDNNGFSLYDLFSYEMKHNEANGEDNHDGLEWNFSSNCGVEGDTTSRNVMKIRERKMRNAILMLGLSQGVPMIMAGDEDYNSQSGNNNVYCQDNAVGYKDWKRTASAKNFTKYVKDVLKFRKEHEILRSERPMTMMDPLGSGYPDLSYHEESAWICENYCNRRAIGILYNGCYEKETQDIYVGFNFSDYHKKMAIPKMKGRGNWSVVINTAFRQPFVLKEELSEEFYDLEAHSICVLVAGKEDDDE